MEFIESFRIRFDRRERTIAALLSGIISPAAPCAMDAMRLNSLSLSPFAGFGKSVAGSVTLLPQCLAEGPQAGQGHEPFGLQ